MVQIFVLHSCSPIHFVYLISHNLRYYLYHVKAIIYDTMKKSDIMYLKDFVKRFLLWLYFFVDPHALVIHHISNLNSKRDLRC